MKQLARFLLLLLLTAIGQAQELIPPYPNMFAPYHPPSLLDSIPKRDYQPLYIKPGLVPPLPNPTPVPYKAKPSPSPAPKKSPAKKAKPSPTPQTFYVTK